MEINPLTSTDAYKLSHKGFMDPKTEKIYSNLTPRTGKYMPVLDEFYDGRAVFFGLQRYIKDILINNWNKNFFHKPKEEVISKFKRRTDAYLGKDSVCMKHFEELHDLGYLPISIKALSEGSVIPMKIPFLTIVNTDNRFAWITNFLETSLSCELWKPCYTATVTRELRKLVEKFAYETVGNCDHTGFQLHGFEFRGMCGAQDAAIASAGLLLNSFGTDTIVAIDMLEEFYSADAEKELIAASVPASEHAVTSLGTSLTGELEFFREAITKHYPTGIVSLVSDTYDFFRVVTEFATELKEDILNRKVNELGLAKVVFRPDSGVPADIVCGIQIKDYNNNKDINSLELAKIYAEEDIVDKVGDETAHGECGDYESTDYFRYGNKIYKITVEIEWNRYDKQYYYIDGHSIKSCEEVILTPEQKGAVECLWDVFGGAVSEKGYKVLHERVGLIYGDGITQKVMFDIFTRLKNKGFAANNITFGVGSMIMTYATRDSLGIAQKATWAQVDGKGYDLYKSPKTDDGMKKSAKGLLRVDIERGAHGGTYVLKDQCTPQEEAGGELKEVFRDGKLLIDQSLSDIRARIRAHN